MTDTANRVKKIVAEHLGVEESKVTDTASFIDDLGADSLDTVELVMAFEEEFGCEIPDEAAEKIWLPLAEALTITGKTLLPESRQSEELMKILNCMTCRSKLPARCRWAKKRTGLTRIR